MSVLTCTMRGPNNYEDFKPENIENRLTKAE